MELENNSVVTLDEKELISSSPDSGIGLNDSDGKTDHQKFVHGDTESIIHKAEVKTYLHAESKFSSQNTLDPFVYKYDGPDNRKLTLLKSLSQDSEYSLDSSVFDAEDILQELGFAGTGDPAIPDRFLPSLMQRLSKFPESEIDCLHDRILQSIGSFRRKEGKRRLFRNLSMGKDFLPGACENNCLSCHSTNGYPLLRSNTGPAAFPFDDHHLAAAESSQCGAPNLNSNCSASADVLNDEQMLPQSPIAIFVSAASLDQDASSQHSRESENAVSENIADLQSATKEGTVVEHKHCFNAHKSQDVEVSHEEHSTDSSALFTTENIVFENHSGKEVCLVQREESDNILPHKYVFYNNDRSSVEVKEFLPDDPVIHKSSKPPLKRTSKAYSLADITKYSHQLKYKNFVRQTQTDEDVAKSTDAEGYNHRKSDSADGTRGEGLMVCTKSEELSSYMSSQTGTVKEILRRERMSQEGTFKNDAASIAVKEYSSFNKPKYSKTRSLTDFLTSMLNTTEDSRYLNLSRNEQNLVSDKSTILADTTDETLRLSIHNNVQSNSESNTVMTGLVRTPSSEPVLTVTDTFVEDCQKDCSNNSTKLQDSDVLVNNTSTVEKLDSAEKSVNRKRRILRRMSSSLQDPDFEEIDENYKDLRDSKHTNCTTNFERLGSNTSSVSQRKLPLRNTKSAPLCKTPTELSLVNTRIHSYSCENVRKVTNEFKNCAQNTNVNGKESPEDENRLFHRKPKRISSRRRIHSCLSRNTNFNFNPDINCVPLPPQNPLEKLDSFNQAQTTPLSTRNSSNYVTLLPRYDMKEQQVSLSSCNAVTKCSRSSQTEYFEAPKISSPPNREGCKKNFRRILSSTPLKAPSTNNFFPSRTCSQKFRYYCWNCTPKVTNEYDHRRFRNDDQSCCTQNFTCANRESTGRELNFREGLHKYEYDSDSSFFEESYFPDDVFIPELTEECCCSFLDPQHNPELTLQGEKAFPSHSPKNVPRTSAGTTKTVSPNLSDNDDKLYPSTSVKTSGKVFLTSGNLKKGTVHLQETSLSKASESLDGQKKESRIFTLGPTRRNSEKTITGVTKRKLSIQDTDISAQPVSQNKREAMLERKIRIFSKFLSSLGNLSKLVPDKPPDSIPQTPCRAKQPVPRYSDKTFRSQTENQKCSTTPPEVDQLMCFLKKMNSEKVAEHRSSAKSDTHEFSGVNNRLLQSASNPVYRNRVLLQAKSGDGQFKPVLYVSSVSMQINEEEKSDRDISRLEKAPGDSQTLTRTESPLPSECPILALCQVPFKGVCKELEELQMSIQKAKETRICASKELHLLQELLSGDERSELQSTKKPDLSAESLLGSQNSKKGCEKTFEALSDLQEKSKRDVPLDSDFWQEEMEKVKEQKDRAWQERLKRMEERLANQEEELHRVQSEKEDLQKRLESRSPGSPTCHCKSDVIQNGYGRIDSAFEDDEEFLYHKPSTPIQSLRQECDRLQEKLQHSEQRADELNLLLNQKLIELNKLQITLSKQTKEIIELEKSYIQLQCRFRRGASKPIVARLCSRTSPFSSKNLFPKPSPPASPVPTSICP